MYSGNVWLPSWVTDTKGEKDLITKPMDVLERFPIRKTKKQKCAFRKEVQDFAQKHGYSVRIETGSFGANNMVIGDPAKAQYLVTAHYDTPASIGIPNFVTPCNVVLFLLFQILVVGVLLAVSVGMAMAVGHFSGNARYGLITWYIVYFGILYLMMLGPANRNNANDNTSGVVTVLETMVSLPENQRDKVCFVLFDLEEAGLVGSASYRKAHKKETDRQLILNLDCVGDGDAIVLFPTAKLRKNEAQLEKLAAICRSCGEKAIRLHQRGFAYCPSDQKNFPNGVGIMAFHEKKGVGLYCGRIHTWRDKVLEQTNVNILRAALISLIAERGTTDEGSVDRGIIK